MKKSLKKTWMLISGLLILLLIVIVAQTCISAEQKTEMKTAAVYLSDLKPIPDSSPYITDKDMEGNALQINGLKFKKGLCVATNTELIYKIDGKYSAFKAVVGPADAYGEYKGKLIFSVYGDGKKLYETKPLGVREREEVSVKVNDVRSLALRVNDDGLHSQYAIWGDASLY